MVHSATVCGPAVQAPDSPVVDRLELNRIREIAFALPEVNERMSHGTPCFFIRDKKTLCYYHDDHHGDGRLCIWAPAPAGVQDEVVRLEPTRFFVPPYVGHRGWIGVHLNVEPDWDEIAGILEDAYRMVAPKTLVKQLDAASDAANEAASDSASETGESG